MAKTKHSAYRVDIDPEDLRDLVTALKELEGGKKTVNALRKNLRAAAEPAAAQVRSNASWSTRIPAAVGVRVAFTSKRPGVSVFVGRKKAPHARPIERFGVPGTFVHPLFGRDVWVSQQARPFFFNEMQTHLPAVEKAAKDAIDTAATAAGFR